MFDPSKFTTKKPKPLPVVLLLDASTSMMGNKIDNLNQAVQEMIETFAEEEKMETEIIVSVIKFGIDVELLLPYTKASEVKWESLEANGWTPMGEALRMAKAMIEDKDVTPSRAYRPTIVLVSDGQPTDDWEAPLDAFVNSGRSSKCDRMAMAIGKDADEGVLKRFITGTKNDLFYAENASQLREFFQQVTMSVTMRTKSMNPNLVPDPSEIKLDGSFSKTTGTIIDESDDDCEW